MGSTPTSPADFEPGLLSRLRHRQETLWLNERWSAQPEVFPDAEEAAASARARLHRNKDTLASLFPELAATEGSIESPLLSADRLQRAVAADLASPGTWLIKADHALPVAGSVKARGGFNEVLAFAESLVQRHVGEAPVPVRLDSPEARRLFSRYTITVGSTGNLGLAIGLISTALGFKVAVHMSADAKDWKKARLRDRGVEVVEHEGDYAAAVEAGRRLAAADPFFYFVDDEASSLLFAGYDAAADELVRQLDAAGRQAGPRQPLFVYLPCGVGGAPGGICHGLRRRLGEHVHCFFVEPVASPCVLVQLAAGLRSPVSVYDVGLDNRTVADGLAVGQASGLVTRRIEQRVSGVITVSDMSLHASLLILRQEEGLSIEPSACAGIVGPLALLRTKAGQAYIASHRLRDDLPNATHVIWTTGGSLVPAIEQERFESEARRVLKLGNVDDESSLRASLNTAFAAS